MWLIGYRVYLGPPADGSEFVVRGLTLDSLGVVADRIRRLHKGRLCWLSCYRLGDQ